MRLNIVITYERLTSNSKLKIFELFLLIRNL